MKRTFARDPRAAAKLRLRLPVRTLCLSALVLLLLVALIPPGVAQDASQAIVPPPAGTDIETLRKLLGLPSRPEPAPAPAPEPPAAAPEVQAPPPAEPAGAVETKRAEPEPAKPSAATKPATRAKSVAKPAPKRPATPVVKAAPAVPAPAEAKDDTATGAEAGSPAPEKAPARTPAASIVEGSPEDVPPAGMLISRENQERWKHLLGPSIQWAVSRGATLPVIDALPAPMEPFREEATRRYSAQVVLAPDGNSMRDYVAGIPFPLVDDNDPQVAVKMMFNFENRISVDDVALRNFACDTGRIPPKGGIEIERHYEVDAFRRIFYTGRFHHEPKPTWSTTESVRYREMLGALQEPFDLKGSGFTYIRYLDPGRPDDSWLYFPQLKRVRRLSSAQRSEGVFGQDVDLDSYAGYAGNPAWSNWKYLGKKTVLGVLHAQNLPAKWQDAPADFFADDVWEPREVYILLAVSRLGGYNFGQRVLYLDRESLLIPYTEIYDLKGSLWKSLVQTWALGKKPVATARKAVYDYDQFYIPSLSMMDIQMNHVTRCQLPGTHVKNEEGWYFNMGTSEGTSEEVFSVSHFIEQGR